MSHRKSARRYKSAASRRRSRKPSATLGIIKWAVIGLFVTAGLLFGAAQTAQVLRQAEFFRVREVVRDPSLHFIESRFLDQLTGHSIFDVDIAGLERHLRQKYPQVERLDVVRRFPDRVLITARAREPLAWLPGPAGTGAVVLDRDGVVVSFDRNAARDLPRIEGVELAADPALGKPLRRDNVTAGLMILQAYASRPELHDLRVRSMNVENLSIIQMELVNDLKIMMDRDHVERKIGQLAILLNQAAVDLKDVDYIDLRFREPVLGKKTGL